ncbi:MAG: hypothetical protein JSU70_11935 [Phycisphaerales bacterium]|nr:MAG: hypothetical protein JSU70_11935 [Phycisphaerales bacterium]
MFKDRSFFAVVLALIWCLLPTQAQMSTTRKSIGPIFPAKSALSAQPLFSPAVGQVFYGIAYDIANSKDVTAAQAELAVTFLTAAAELDSEADYALPLLIKLGSKHSDRDYSKQVWRWLVSYVDTSADMEVAEEAVTYLLERLNLREERERLLEGMLRGLGGKKDVLDSELATLLGLLKAEKADFEAAKFYLMQAYDKNKYNKLAFAKLAELVPDQVGPAIYLEHLRLVLRENPLDIDTALALAQYAEGLQLYWLAAGAYEYCADLFGYLYPTEALPPHIYLPWVISNYNTQRDLHKCLQTADRIRKTGRFDILLEAIAGRAASKIGNDQEAAQIFRAAEQKAQQLLDQGPWRKGSLSESPPAGRPPQIGAKQFAWFHCFATQDAAKALDWANRAYSTEPNSPAAAALLAYALVINKQVEWAKPLIESYEHNQIGDLVTAHVQLADGQRGAAIETLKSAISKDPGSLAAERARDILTEQGGEYIAPVDGDVIMTVLGASLGPRVIPEFVRPEDAISVQFNIRGNEFSYGAQFGCTVAVVNNSPEPLVVSDDGLFRGNIRIDARVSGDIDREIPNLVSRTIRTSLLVEPGRGLLTSVPLVTGELKRILVTYPQASLEIEFTLYVDPAITEQGQVSNRLVDIEPDKVVVRRPGIELTGTYLRNRFNSISTGQMGQKIKTAQLFVGLLKEQHAMAAHGTLYRFKYADWMPALLKNALIHESGLLLNPTDDEWIVKVHAMAEMLSLPLDQELTVAVADNLNNTHWPVRLMTIYLLSRTADGEFDRVLGWAAEYDSNELVRNMAAALGADQPGTLRSQSVR